MSPPNQLTLFRIVLTPVFAALLLSADSSSRQVALGVFLLAAVTDWYDGWVARRWGHVTRWGKFFDPLADKILTSAAFICFAVIGYAREWMVWAIVLRDFLVTGLRSLAEYRQRSIDTSTLAKTKTLLQMASIYYVLVVYVVRSSPSLSAAFGNWIEPVAAPAIIDGVLLVVTLLTVWTGAVYLYENRTTIREIFSSNA